MAYVAEITNRKLDKGKFRLFNNVYNKDEARAGWLFSLPAVVLATLFIILPIFISLFYAFTDAGYDYVHFNFSLSNFPRMFKDKTVWIALKNTFQFVIEVLPLQFGAALGLALILNKVRKCNTFLRWAFFAPVMLSLAVTSFLWLNLLNEQEGLINALLTALGLGTHKFLGSQREAMHTIVFISAWQGAGYQMLIILAALKNIPKDLYEAASIDRASKWKQFWHITLPSIKPTLVFIFITMLIGAFRICTQIMIMTPNGGVEFSTMTMSYYIYLNGIKYNDLSYSSALALMFTIIMAAISLTLRKVLNDDSNV